MLLNLGVTALTRYADVIRRVSLPAFAAFLALFVSGAALAAPDPLPSWNEGPTKAAIEAFVVAATDPSGSKFVAPAARIAAFDQDGTLWVEHPVYTEVMYTLDAIPALVASRPQLAAVEPFRTVMSGDRAAIGRLPEADLLKLVAATHSGMTVEQFHDEVKTWIGKARDPRFHQLYSDLAYRPMLEAMAYLRAAGFRVYIVTGGEQDFVRAFADAVYGVPPEQVVGTMLATSFADEAGKSDLTKLPRLLLNNDHDGKPQGIHLVIGRRPVIAFGNSDGDREMLEYATGGPGPGMALIVLHDDAAREYAYGPANGLPDSKIGTFSQALFDEAKARGWSVISMKSDWKTIFAFTPSP
jgi:phosphoglycolate phosphatase-like HAD superfamily hydrolase